MFIHLIKAILFILFKTIMCILLLLSQNFYEADTVFILWPLKKLKLEDMMCLSQGHALSCKSSSQLLPDFGNDIFNVAHVVVLER